MRKPAKKSNRTTSKKSTVSGLNKNNPAKYKIAGIILIIASIYFIYAFTTATPGILDNVIGKMILTYLFGNATPILCIYLVFCGVMLVLDKAKYYYQTIILSFLLLINLFMVFSLNIPNLMNYKLLDLFELAIFGKYGGIVGILLSYISQILVAKTGTIILIVLLSIVEILLILRDSFNKQFNELRNQYFGLKLIKSKIIEIKSNVINRKNLMELTKENSDLKQNELGNNKNENFFTRSDEGAVSVDTRLLDLVEIQYMESILNRDREEKNLQDSKDLENRNKIVDDLLTINDEGNQLPLNPDIHEPNASYQLPSLVLLDPHIINNKKKDEDTYKKAQSIETTLSNFGVNAKIIGVDVGPSVTRFELQPEVGVKVNRIVSLADDLALMLATSDIRIEAPIPGKAAIGIEIPNEKSEIVGIREILESPTFVNSKSPLTFALGKTLTGQSIVGDIGKMPHLLIAGATGSGKSVCVNSIIISLLYKASPSDLKLILIDPKMVELNQYNSIPHLLIPVVTDPKKASHALSWGLKEMTDRYQTFKDSGVRDIEGYNNYAIKNHIEKLPRIVIIIDELADLMMTSPKEVENAICRIAQLARACGIHLIIATQRPSVDVITGLIKANIPSRIAFSVTSNTDSRTILDMGGAEKLLGKGDMLYFPVGKSKPLRVQCTYVSDKEINRVIKAVSKAATPQYDNRIEEAIQQSELVPQKEVEADELVEQAIDLAFTYEQISTSMLQRKLKIGYSRAGRLIDTLEGMGIITGPNGSKPRTLLVSRETFERR